MSDRLEEVTPEATTLGSIDRLATNAGLTLVALLPTAFAVIVLPWRVVPLAARTTPEGRVGVYLAPGLFLLLVSIVFLALLSLTETGPQSAQADTPAGGAESARATDRGFTFDAQDGAMVLERMGAGDFGAVLAALIPIFATAVSIGLLASALRPLAGPGWSLSTSLRCAYYLVGGLFALIASLALTLYGLGLIGPGAPEASGSVQANLAVLVYILWFYFWSFRRIQNAGLLKSALLSVGALVVVVGAPLAAFALGSLIFSA